MKVSITGAGGYTGGLLVRAHAMLGDAVHALARDVTDVPALPGVTAYGADLRAPGTIPDAFFERTDVLYHCAAELTREDSMRAVNVEATRALIARARGGVSRWVQLSSLSVYGAPRSGSVTEESALRPQSLYALTKLEADDLVAKHAAGAFSYVLVRPAAVMGRNMRNRSLHALIDAVARGRFCFIGAPGAIGNYVHEESAVDALVLCATRAEAKDRTYNLAQNAAIEDMVATIAAELGRRRKPPRIPEAPARLAARVGRLLPGFPLTSARVDALTSRVEYRAERIERELGFRHRKSIADALRDLVAMRKESAR